METVRTRENSTKALRLKSEGTRKAWNTKDDSRRKGLVAVSVHEATTLVRFPTYLFPMQLSLSSTVQCHSAGSLAHTAKENHIHRPNAHTTSPDKLKKKIIIKNRTERLRLCAKVEAYSILHLRVCQKDSKLMPEDLPTHER